MQQLREGSDRLVLTVRMTKNNKHEWLDHMGLVALVYEEGGLWFGRLDASSPRIAFITELEALDYVINSQAAELRDTLRDDL